MPSLPIELLLLPLIPSQISFHGCSSSHRLKRLEKGNRRGLYAKRNRFIDLGRHRSEVDLAHKLHEPSMNQECPDNAHLDDLINEIENSLSEALHIEEDDVKCASNVDGNSKVVLERNESDEPDIQQSKCFLKCLNKSATFPFPSMALPADASADGEDKEPPRNAYPRSISLLTPSKLVSAMKGSREKLVGSQTKLTVTWAADVYDPTPTTASHTVNKGKKQKSKNKKNWKKDRKKKGNSSRAGGGKDKKQSCKPVGDSDKSYKSMNAHEKFVEANEEDFDGLIVGSPDPNSYCGSSFLKKSLTKMHYPVAEAL